MHAPAASVAGVAGPGQRAHRMTELLISAVPSGVTGWRSLALGDELTGADLDVLALGDQLARPSIRPTSWRSARNRRARTGREAVEMAGG